MKGKWVSIYWVKTGSSKCIVQVQGEWFYMIVRYWANAEK